MSNSLVIIATHEPPEISHAVLPTVRILRLVEPLAIEDAGAVRFVNVLEWAERVARIWRKHGGFGAVVLNENEDGQEYLPPPSILRFKGSQSTPPSPRSSASLLVPDFPPSRPRSVSARLLPRSRASLMPTVDPSQRPFDHLINFLPKNTPDKALLKQAILVTTISRPFLVASSPSLPDRHRGKLPFTSRSSSSVYLSTSSVHHSGDSLTSLLVLPTKAHIVHVLPHESRPSASFGRSKLIQSLEGFLVSFAFPPSLKRSNTPGDDALEPARPYIMDTRTFGVSMSSTDPGPGPSTSPYIPWPAEYSISDLILCGTLDDVQSQPVKPGQPAPPPPRAFISGATDIVLVSDDTPLPLNVPGSIPQEISLLPSPRVRQRHLQNAYDSLTASSASGSVGASSGASMASSFAPSSWAPHPVGSPLAPRRSKREIQNRYSSSFGGLPTPPDSEESGSELPATPPQQQQTLTNEKKERGFLVTHASVSPVSSKESSDDSGPQIPHYKTIRLRWKFWKGSIWSSK